MGSTPSPLAIGNRPGVAIAAVELRVLTLASKVTKEPAAIQGNFTFQNGNVRVLFDTGATLSVI